MRKKMNNFSSASPRIEKLRNMYLNAKPNIDIQRAVLMHEMYKAGKFDGLSRIMLNAKFLEYYLQNQTIYLEEGQLIASKFANGCRAVPVYPEAGGAAMINEYRKARTREIDPFIFDEEDEKKLEFILNDMKDAIPSLRNTFYDLLTMEEKSFFLKNPENDYTTGTQICSMDAAINGPGGHISADYQTVVEHGLDYLIRQAEVRMRQAIAEKDTEAIEFLNAATITMKAAIAYANRFSKLAAELAEKETDATRKKELLRMSDACAHVPQYPSRSFYEAAQCTWFLFVIIQLEANQRCFSVGRFDQFAYPCYKADIENGVTTKQEAQEILDCLWMKFCETNHFNSESFSRVTAGFAPQQQFVAGGVDRDGRDATNELSYMEIQSAMNTRLAQPSISCRIWEGSPDEFIRKACELSRLGTGHPSFFNDTVVIPSLADKGVMIEDARDYSIAGCSSIQPTRRDKGSHNGGYLNLAACMEFVLNDGFWKKGNRQFGLHTGDPRNFKTFEEFNKAFQDQFAYMIRIHAQSSVKVEIAHREVSPTPFLSCLVGDCISKGRDRTNGGAFYNLGISPRAIGLADVVDSLMVVKKLVFDEKKITIDELVNACNANWDGYAELRKMVETRAPKYGNDIDEVDQIGCEFTKFYSDETRKYKSLFGGAYLPGFSTVAANVGYGKPVAALPTGRLEYTPLADGVGPCHHMDVEGPTAVAISSGKLDHFGMAGGSILNLRFSPQTVADDKGLENLVAFVKGACEAGVWHMQFNVNDTKTLLEAQKNPAEYSDLLVRVAGYSALFVSLTKDLQDDIIDRTVHAFVA